MRFATAEDAIEEMKFLLTYFEHFVDQDPLFWPELERAHKIIELVTRGGAGLTERVRSCLAAPMSEHFDGSAWAGFKVAVAEWLELAEQGRARSSVSAS